MTGIVHVVGSANIDLKLQLERFAGSGETIMARTVSREPGGKGLNQAVAARRAGAQVHFVGVSGSDDAGRMLHSFLAGEGIDLRDFESRDGVTTGLAVVSLTDAGENSIVVVAGANALVTPTLVTESLAGVDPGDVVLLQLETPLESVRAAVEVARDRGAIVVLNAAPYRQGALELTRLVDVLVVNETEMIGLSRESGSGHIDPKAAAMDLAGWLGVTIVCTLGVEGALVVTRSETVERPALVVPAIDTTAAGDTFVGFLAQSLLADVPWSSALTAANAASAITVTRRGAAASIPFHAELVG